MKEKDLLISVILPLRVDQRLSIEDLTALQRALSNEYEMFEILLVYDGKCSHRETIAPLLMRLEGLRVIQLSKTSGFETAISAGLESAIGDYCVVAIPGEDPLPLIPDILRKARSTGKIVLGQNIGASTGRWLYRSGRKVFDIIANRFLGLEIPLNTTFFCCLNRQAVHQITKTKDRHRFLRAISAHIGLDYELFPYAQAVSPSGGKTLWQAVSQSLHVIALNTSGPLRVAAMTSWMLFVGNLIYLFYVLFTYVLRDSVQQGWATTSLQISGNFALMFFVLAVALEYLKVIVEESKSRPSYYVHSESTSHRVVFNADATNTVGESTRV